MRYGPKTLQDETLSESDSRSQHQSVQAPLQPEHDAREGLQIVCERQAQPKWQIAVPVWNLVSLITSITLVELTIKLNDMKAVNALTSSGQLMALIVSIGAFMYVILEIVARQRRISYGERLLYNRV